VPTFSVIIPTYNRAAVLPDAIESVFGQSVGDLELIVVDDGSTDDTAAILAKYGGRLTVVRQSNAGAAAARNRGLDIARGRYLAFLDSDDAWAPWTVEMLSRAVTEFGGPAILAGYGSGWDKRQRAAREEPQYRASGSFLRASVRHSAFHGMGGLAIRADVMRAAGGFRPAFLIAEDQDLCLRLGDAGGFVEILAPSLFFQRTNLDHLSSDVAKTIAATDLLIENERASGYPGGEEFAAVRRGIICAAARRASDMCARAGRPAEAWRLYRRTFRWHLASRRWRFLLGFPIVILLAGVKPA
jgi:glycosyltransferase involved in cell wall biosynthesis